MKSRFAPVSVLFLLALFCLCPGACSAAPEIKQDGLASLQLQPNQDFKIEYLYFSGLPNRFERHEALVRGADLPDAERLKVRDLVNDSRMLIATEKEFEMLDGGAAYKITVSTGCVARTVQWTADHAPHSMDKLVKYLDKNSKVEKKGLP